MKKTRIAVVGGGTGGMAVVSALRQLPIRDNLEVTLVEPSDSHFYQPQWTMVGGGLFPREVTRRPMAELVPRGVQWVREACAEFLPADNQLLLADGRRIDYDHLIVATGLKLDWHKIAGLEGNLGKHGLCSNYSYDSVASTWENIRGLTSGVAMFTFPPPPIKCAGAPQKIMYLAEDHFRRSGVRDRISVAYRCAADTIFAVKKYAAVLTDICTQRGIDAQFAWKLVAVDGPAREATFEHTKNGERRTEKYDMLHITPPMSAPSVVSSSPLANEAGFVEVDKFTLQHVRFPNVFSIGDSSSLPTSKTAAAVRAQLPVLVQNLVATMGGRPLSERYDGYTSCPLVTGYGRLVLAEFDYDLNPQETFPFDQGKERLSMYLLKKHVLPYIYWKGLIAGRKWPWLMPESHLKAF
ncbi:MAG: NAD(P)/FAD-dependent oxidoreductase [Gammaproteobacteria bacterium]|nr:NAD(P)/FAD-dependent oxidoreductase [Gammaproteobacteria bacterium]